MKFLLLEKQFSTRFHCLFLEEKFRWLCGD